MPSKRRLQEIADSTLKMVNHQRIHFNGNIYDLSEHLDKSKRQTTYYPPDSPLSAWKDVPPPHSSLYHPPVVIEFLETTTLAAATRAGYAGRRMPIGVLNFASAEQPGGGFINGSPAQEESIARSSTLYASLTTPTAQQFYALHRADGRDGFYTHAMVYSPHVVVFRNDEGDMARPMEIDVLTSPAVNAALVRRKVSGPRWEVEREIKWRMRGRMARILYLFECQHVRTLILGSFGTGVFRNDVDMVAKLWAELLTGPNARFKHSFDYVAFAVMDHDTYSRFKRAFGRR
ncbi:hypothetical protein C8R46DRAFT_1341847 [Mycena filopes]|nr:hypothetical protein C8R46DRAFT_1341847 [Mycena filopes]